MQYSFSVATTRLRMQYASALRHCFLLRNTPNEAIISYQRRYYNFTFRLLKSGSSLDTFPDDVSRSKMGSKSLKADGDVPVTNVSDGDSTNTSSKTNISSITYVSHTERFVCETESPELTDYGDIPTITVSDSSAEEMKSYSPISLISVLGKESRARADHIDCSQQKDKMGENFDSRKSSDNPHHLNMSKDETLESIAVEDSSINFSDDVHDSLNAGEMLTEKLGTEINTEVELEMQANITITEDKTSEDACSTFTTEDSLEFQELEVGELQSAETVKVTPNDKGVATETSELEDSDWLEGSLFDSENSFKGP